MNLDSNQLNVLVAGASILATLVATGVGARRAENAAFKIRAGTRRTMLRNDRTVQLWLGTFVAIFIGLTSYLLRDVADDRWVVSLLLAGIGVASSGSLWRTANILTKPLRASAH